MEDPLSVSITSPIANVICSIPIILNAGLPSEAAALFGAAPALEGLLIVALPAFPELAAGCTGLAPAAFSADGVPALSAIWDDGKNVGPEDSQLIELDWSSRVF